MPGRGSLLLSCCHPGPSQQPIIQMGHRDGRSYRAVQALPGISKGSPAPQKSDVIPSLTTREAEERGATGKGHEQALLACPLAPESISKLTLVKASPFSEYLWGAGREPCCGFLSEILPS